MKKALTLVLTSLICLNLGVSRVFADGDTFTNFVDVDPDTLIDITSSYSLSDIWYTVHKNLVIDSAINYDYQMQFEVSGTHTIAFTGSYYDNSIVSMESCNSSTYHYNTSSQTVDSVLVVEPAVYGSLSHNSQNMILNFGIDVNSAYSGAVSTTTSAFDNTSQACALLGMNDGDGAIDGTVLLEAGYEKKTITYNDGSLNGHTATFYVPGSESINFKTEQLDDLIQDIYANILNKLRIDYHYEYDLWLTTRNKVMPSYGFIGSNVWLPLMLDSRIVDYNNGFNNYLVFPKELDHTSVNNNTTFTNSSNDSIYNGNYTNLYWSGTNNPHWTFMTNRFRDEYYNQQSGSIVVNDVIDGQYDTFTTAQLSSNPLYYTINSDRVAYQSSYNLTSGYRLPVGMRGFNYFYVYKQQDTSRLNLFNQLGSFLQSQFNRLVNSIGEITGGGEGTDIAQDIQNDYNIDIDLDINNSVSNLVDKDSDIDLTAPEFVLPSGDSLSLLSDIPSDVIGIFTRNSLGFMIFLPFIIAIVGKVLK